MLADFVAKISDLAAKAAGAAGRVQVLDVGGYDPPHIRRLVVQNPDGSVRLDRLELEAGPMRGEVAAWWEIPEAVAAFRRGLNLPCIVWYGKDGLVAVCGEDRRSFARASLEDGPQWLAIKELTDRGKVFACKDLRRWLNTTMVGTWSDRRLANWLSSVRFESGSVTRVELSKSKASLGRDVEEAVYSAGGECPDEITFCVRVFDEDRLAEKCVRCVVEVQPVEGTVWIGPYPGDLERAQRQALAEIGERLRLELPDDVPVLFGVPIT